jgi:phosphatidate cytidylyltransferase
LRYSDDDDGGSARDDPGDDELKEPSGVTITGAHQAVGRAAQETQSTLDDWTFPRNVPSDAELQHWTEAPTGQVPAVLARDDATSTSDDPWSSVQSPTWRENESDWTDQEQRFEPAMLGDEGGGLSQARGDDDRRPWEFDEPTSNQTDDDPTLVGGFVTSDPPAPASTTATATATATVPPRARARTTHARRPESTSLAGRAARPASTSRDMRLAILTGFSLGILVLVVFDLSTLLSIVLASAVVTLAAGEAFSGLRIAGHRPAAALGLAACLALMVASYNKGVLALPLVAALCFFFTFLWFVVGVEHADIVDGVGTTMFVFVWVGILASFAGLLLAPGSFPDNHGIHFVLGAIVVVVANDLSALIFGKLFGRHAMAPTISPNKTWEGAIGAAVVTVIAGACVSLIPGWTLRSAFALGVAAAFLAPLGDLCESMIKRSLGVKDMGKSLPGHGGLLDRVDGLLFVLPATYYVVLAFHLG